MSDDTVATSTDNPDTPDFMEWVCASLTEVYESSSGPFRTRMEESLVELLDILQLRSALSGLDRPASVDDVVSVLLAA